MVTYIHYGSDHFDKFLFKPLKNRRTFPASKPDVKSGLWASPVDSKYGWKDWVIEQDFGADLQKSFKFQLKNQDKIFDVSTIEDAIDLIKRYYLKETEFHKLYYVDSLETILDNIASKNVFLASNSFLLDFEKMQNDGYTGLEIHIAKNPMFYYLFYGWDMDSIIVWNVDEIIPVS